MRWKVYPEYKDSGIDLLGDVPEHWEVGTLRRMGRFSASGIDKKSEDGQPRIWMVNYTDVYGNAHGTITSDRALMETTAPTEKIRRHQLLKGDVLFTPSSETLDEIGISAVVMEDMPDTVYSYHLIRFRPHIALCLRFRKYFCNHPGVWAQFSRASKGTTRQILTREDFKAIATALPSLDEQRIIAAFLDRETNRIDVLIAKKERQIELLQEKRTALISHAVTKGLNPDVKMKDSGVEWMGEIPEHWEVIPIKRVARMDSGHTPDKKVEEYWTDCTIPWISLNDTTYLKDNDYIEDTAYHVNELGLANSSAHLLPARAVIFTRDATIGLSAITTRPMAVSQHIIAWLCGPKIIPEYLLRVFYAMIQELERLCMGSTLRTLGMPDVLELVTPLPPVKEQEQIARVLSEQVEQIDIIIAKVQESTNMLHEYRTALILAAVTGKIDVRGSV